MRKGIFVSIFAALLVLLMSVTAFASDDILAEEGMSGPSVKNVQELLQQQHFDVGEIDGVCGPMTAKAIARFQKKNGLEVNGIVDEVTYRELSGGVDYVPQVSAISALHAMGETVDGEHNHADYVMKRVVYVSATAYSATDPGLSSYTATGTLVRHGVIAVDPSFIPLGTMVCIPGYGDAIAEDMGNFGSGNVIDVAFDTHEEALEFGRQDLEIIILE